MNRRRYKEQVPEVYQVLEYLESTGTQYIDTGVIQNQDSGIETEFQWTDLSKSSIFIGARTAYEVNMFGIQKLAANYFTTIYGTQTVINWIAADTNWHKASLLKNVAKIDSTSRTYNKQTFSCPTNCILFGFSSPTGVSINSAVRLKYTKLYQNNILIRDFIPVRRMSDNELGMYDRVSGKFYTNRGTGTFIGGNATGEIIGLSVLPSEYQAVEYLESTGTQWIDMGISSANISIAEFKNAITEKNTNTYATICGVLGADDYSKSIVRLVSWFSSSYNAPMYYMRTPADIDHNKVLMKPMVKQVGVEYTERVEVTKDNKLYATINGTRYGGTDVGEPLPPNTRNLYLFAYNYDNDTPARLSKIKLYYIILKDVDENPIIHFIPCKRKSDNKPGMYNTVNNKFYTNAGTGEFLVGPDIDLSIDCDTPGELGPGNPQKAKFIGYKEVSGVHYQVLDYIQSSGNSCIETDIIVGTNDTISIENKITMFKGANRQFIAHIDGTSTGYTELMVNGKYGIYNAGSISASDTYDIMNFTWQNLGSSGQRLIQFTINGLVTRSGSTTRNIPTDSVLKFFNHNNDGIFPTLEKFWYAIIKINDVIVGDFIPVRNLETNELGLYDKINDKFYKNMHINSDDFVAGNPTGEVITIVDRLWDYKRGLYNTKTGEFTKL